MRDYTYIGKWEKLLTPDTIYLLTAIHEYKGAQKVLLEGKSEGLEQLAESARIQSVENSCKMEGIDTSEERFKKLILNKTRPRTRKEQEIAGYRDVLTSIHESYEYISPKSPVILQLHRDLYKYSGCETSGQYKASASMSKEEMIFAMECLGCAFEEAMKEKYAEPLLVIPMFILDFLCIHPFYDGNEQMSRLLMLLLLNRAGYIVGQYVSIEGLMKNSCKAYHEAIQSGATGWNEGRNDYTEFVKYMLGIVLETYREFSSKVQMLVANGVSKSHRISDVIKRSLGKITKAQIAQECPDISLITIQRTLIELQKEEKIVKIGGGRYTAYIWNRENE